MQALKVYNLLGNSGQPLEYQRYLRLQARLRARRRECLIICEHPATITAGIQSRPDSLIATPAELTRSGVALLSVGRAGDHTAHEPGQCVIYPHIDLRARGIGVAQYFNLLLDCVAASLEETWGIASELRADAPGLYLPDSGAKIASIGILFKSFFTSFGVAINIQNDLSTFAHIHPCGYAGQAIASVAGVNGDPVEVPRFLNKFTDCFQLKIQKMKIE